MCPLRPSARVCSPIAPGEARRPAGPSRSAGGTSVYSAGMSEREHDLSPALADARRKRERARKKQDWKVIRNESEECAASVERDLRSLPTTEERNRS